MPVPVARRWRRGRPAEQAWRESAPGRTTLPMGGSKERSPTGDGPAGDAFSLADCAAAPALFYADWVHESPPNFRSEGLPVALARTPLLRPGGRGRPGPTARFSRSRARPRLSRTSPQPLPPRPGDPRCSTKPDQAAPSRTAAEGRRRPLCQGRRRDAAIDFYARALAPRSRPAGPDGGRGDHERPHRRQWRLRSC
jgi:hypothetical protein